METTPFTVCPGTRRPVNVSRHVTEAWCATCKETVAVDPGGFLAAHATPNAKVTVTMEPVEDGLDVMLYRMAHAGVCGPFSEVVTVKDLAELDAQVEAWGFLRVEDFGPLCANGFAEAKVVGR